MVNTGDDVPRPVSVAEQAQVGLIAQQGVSAFLEMVGRGLPVVVCENTQCRVALYTVAPVLGRKVATCPGCYGSPAT